MPEGPSSAQWFWRMQTLKAELMRPASVPLEDESESALRCRGWREPV